MGTIGLGILGWLILSPLVAVIVGSCIGEMAGEPAELQKAG